MKIAPLQVLIFQSLLLIGCGDPPITNPADPNFNLNPPQLTRVVAVDDHTQLISWTEGDAYLQTHILERAKNGNDYSVLGSVAAMDTSYLDTECILGQEYQYRLRSKVESNTSDASNVLTGFTSFPEPEGLSVENLDASTIALSWQDITDFELGFNVERDQGDGFVLIAQLPADMTAYVDAGITYGTVNHYRVQAFTSQNVSAYSNSATEYACDDCVIDVDGNVYSTFRIGDQIWMHENLRVHHYQNGDSISNLEYAQWQYATSGAYCSYYDDPNAGYYLGHLYNWYAVDDERGLAPVGWHVATDADFRALEVYLGVSPVDAQTYGMFGTYQGAMLAGESDSWADGELKQSSYFGDSGFDAMAGGIRSYGFRDIGEKAFFWTGTTSSTNMAMQHGILYNSTNLYRDQANKWFGCSVRCVKD